MNEDVEKLISAGKLASNQKEALLALAPGSICSHPSFGVGKVASWDLLGDRMTIDFQEKAAHPMGIRIALKTLKALASDHILAQFFANPAAIREFAVDDPVAFTGSVLRSVGGTMRFDEFETLVKGRIVSEAAYKKWWDNTKKHLRGHREFVIPSKRTEPLQLRVSDLSPAELLIEDFDLARDLKEKSRLLGEMRKHLDFFANPATDLAPVLENAGDVAMKSQKLNPAGAIDLMLARDALASALKGYRFPDDAPDLAKLIRLETPHLAEALRSLSASAAGVVADALPAAYGETWAEKALQLLETCGAKAFGELANRLMSGEAAPAFALWIRRGLAQRSHTPEALGWICQNRSGSSREFFDQGIGLALLEAIDRAFTSSGSTRGNRALDVLQGDRALIAELLADASPNEVRAFAKRLLATPAIDDLTRRSLLARVIKAHDFVQEMVDGDAPAPAADDSLIVSWESLERKKAELEDLVRNLIPDNTRQIAIAREYGDLRENFEFKSAKDNQKVLDRRKHELEKEIQRAKGINYADADASTVSIGTVASIRFEDGSAQDVAVLGAWDGDPARHILSYLSPAGQTLMGLAVGASVSLPGESEGQTRSGTITSIRKWSESPI